MNARVPPPTVKQFASTLEAALDMARRGFRVFPLLPDSKKPPTFMQKWPYAAATDEAKIREWFTEGDWNYGMVLDGIAVADIDPRNGGDESFPALQKEHGLTAELNPTLVVKTHSGGYHFFYKTDEPLKSRAHAFAKGIDLKTGAGAYVVGPGSTINGRKYEILRDRPVGKMPASLLELAKKNGKRSEKSENAGKRLVDETDEAIERAEAWLRTQPTDIPEGERNDTTYRMAAKLYASGSNAPPCAMIGERSTLDASELDTIADSAGRNRQKAIGTDHPDYCPFPAQEIEPKKRENEKRSKLHYLTLEQSEAKISEPRPKHLIDGLIPAGAMVVTYGESNEGKSFHVMDRDMHQAGGKEWCGRKVHQSGVVWVAAELSDDLHDRIAAVRQHLDLPINTPFFAVPCLIDLLRPGGDTEPLIALVKEIETKHSIKVGKITIDTLSRALAGGNENAPDDMGTLVKHLDRIRYECGCTVEAIHHCGKDTARGARGHSLLRAATDTEIEVGGGRIRVTKQRTMKGGDGFSFRLKERRVGLRHDGKEATSCYVETVKGDKCPKEWRMQLTPMQQQWLDELKKAKPAEPFPVDTAEVIWRLEKRTTTKTRLRTLYGAGYLEQPKTGFYRIKKETAETAVSTPEMEASFRLETSKNAQDGRLEIVSANEKANENSDRRPDGLETETP
jgi:AAA domain/Bifunctional DNA primase/polymerase, N-terminal